jgi:hypothetical protein
MVHKDHQDYHINVFFESGYSSFDFFHRGKKHLRRKRVDVGQNYSDLSVLKGMISAADLRGDS